MWKQGNPLSNTVKDTSTIMCNASLYTYSGKGLHMIVLVYIILDSIAKGIACFHNFSHGASHIVWVTYNKAMCTC